MTFTLTSTSNIVLETSASETSSANSDTRMWIYNNSGDNIFYNDDGGYSVYSKLQVELPAGTYYIKIDEYNGGDIIDSYNILLTTDTDGTSPVTIYGEEVQTQSGETIDMPVFIANNAGTGGATALQMDVTFDPSKVSVTGQSNGANLSPADSSGNLISAGLYRIVITDFSSNLLNNGHLVNLNVDVNSSTPQGRYPINFENVLLSDANSNALTPASVTPGIVDVNLLSTINLEVGTSSGAPGSTVTLPISISNNDAITAGQFDVTWDDSKFTLNSYYGPSSSATITASNTSGRLRVVITNFDGQLLADGGILNVTFNIASTVADGSYPVSLSNIQLADNNAILRTPTSVSSGNIVVTSVTPGDANGDGVVNIQDVVEMINIILGTSNGNSPGADVNGDGEVNIQDVVEAINLILAG